MEGSGSAPRFAATNPRLVYGRITGWGQTTPRAALLGNARDDHRTHRHKPDSAARTLVGSIDTEG